MAIATRQNVTSAPTIATIARAPPLPDSLRESLSVSMRTISSPSTKPQTPACRAPSQNASQSHPATENHSGNELLGSPRVPAPKPQSTPPPHADSAPQAPAETAHEAWSQPAPLTPAAPLATPFHHATTLHASTSARANLLSTSRSPLPPSLHQPQPAKRSALRSES